MQWLFGVNAKAQIRAKVLPAVDDSSLRDQKPWTPHCPRAVRSLPRPGCSLKLESKTSFEVDDSGQRWVPTEFQPSGWEFSEKVDKTKYDDVPKYGLWLVSRKLRLVVRCMLPFSTLADRLVPEL
jgi:hypothetical protein